MTPSWDEHFYAYGHSREVSIKTEMSCRFIIGPVSFGGGANKKEMPAMRLESRTVVSKQDRGRETKVDSYHLAVHILQLCVHGRLRHPDVPNRREGIPGEISREMPELRHEAYPDFSS
jgi:hypothetical protein